MEVPADRLTAALSDRYHIEREIGSGGMATVYLAQDLKHDRKVAVKVLRPELAAVLGAERFLSEIKVTANLQHPHILPLFDSGEADGFLFYVMPYVEGESLRAKLDREKQLPVDEAVRLAGEVADALDHAHRKGVIHRDVKPGNILLHEGRALVADFGIALAVSAAGGPRLTETGLSLGTPHYMSPEQAAGEQELDGRSDLYSLAAVVYEMLAGRPPHEGPTAQAVVAKILTERPEPLRRARPRSPPWVEDAVDRALEKIPADRHASAGDFARDLRTARRVARSGSVRLWRAVAVTAIVTACVTLLLAREFTDADLPSAPPPQVTAVERPVTFSGEAQGVALSPDGTMVAYWTPGGLVTRDAAGGKETVVLEVGDPALGIVGSSSALLQFDPQWSPDGLGLTFGATLEGGLFRVASVPRHGGDVRPIADFRFQAGEAMATHQLSPDGGRLLVVRVLDPVNAQPWLIVRDLVSSEETGIHVGEGAVRVWDGVLSPDGRWIAYVAERADFSTFLATVSVEDKTPTILLEGRQELSKWPETSSSPTWVHNRTLKWVAGDRLYFRKHGSRGLDLWVVRIDPASGKMADAPRPVYPRLPQGASFDISGDARTMAYAGGSNQAHVHLLYLENEDGRTTIRDSLLTRGTGWNVGARVSPDGLKTAFLAKTLSQTDVMIAESGSGGLRRVNIPYQWTSIWSLAWGPDSRSIALKVVTSTGLRLLIIDSDSETWKEVAGVVPGPASVRWSPDGRYIIYASDDAGYWTLREMESGRERRLFESVGGEFVFAIFSRDGQKVLGADITGNILWAADVNGEGLQEGPRAEDLFKLRPVGWGGEGPVTLLDIYSGVLWTLPWEGGEMRLLAKLPFPCIHEGGSQMSADGRVLTCSVRSWESDVWVVEDFDSEVAPAGSGSPP